MIMARWPACRIRCSKLAKNALVGLAQCGEGAVAVAVGDVAEVAAVVAAAAAGEAMVRNAIFL
jgi:hypothetical protein